MKIFNLKTPTLKQPNFCAKKLPKKCITQTCADIIDLAVNKGITPPPKLEFSEVEKIFNEILIKLKKLSFNIKTQKENLRYYYSTQDKFDYKDLLKEKRNLTSKLKRIAKSQGRDYTDMELDIETKKEYNRYAAKVSRTTTAKELNDVIDLINSQNLWKDTRKLLYELVESHKINIKKQ